MKDEDGNEKINIFSSRKSDWWNNACLNFTHRENTWFGYSMGYKRGASILAAYVDNQQEYQDTLIFPIVFLYRHYIELMLKQILKNCAIILEIKITCKTHSLKKCWELSRDKIHKCAEKPLPKEYSDAIEHIASQLDDVDRVSDAFRYPTRKDGAPTLSGITYINIKQLSEEMANVSEMLEGIELTLQSVIDYKDEYLSSVKNNYE